MALEAVVYPQNPFSYIFQDSSFYSFMQASHSTCNNHYKTSVYDHQQQEAEKHNLPYKTEHNMIITQHHNQQQLLPNAEQVMHQEPCRENWDYAPNYYYYSSSPKGGFSVVDQSIASGGFMLPAATGLMELPETTAAATVGRRKRRRTRTCKNKEEVEKQRMTHIAVERNRRKQMNEYLTLLRSLMPPAYVQRGDQASIVGGAIHFVKELEQLLQTMESHKKADTTKQAQQHHQVQQNQLEPTTPFSQFFTFPQYSTTLGSINHHNSPPLPPPAAADIEVTMVDNHANVKILSKKRPRQLLKLVAGLHGLMFSVLHLNVTSIDQLVLYSVSVKVEEGCHLTTVDEIAAALNQMLHQIEEESTFS